MLTRTTNIHNIRHVIANNTWDHDCNSKYLPSHPWSFGWFVYCNQYKETQNMSLLDWSYISFLTCHKEWATVNMAWNTLHLGRWEIAPHCPLDPKKHYKLLTYFHPKILLLNLVYGHSIPSKNVDVTTFLTSHEIFLCYGSMFAIPFLMVGS